MSDATLTMTSKIHFKRGESGRVEMRRGDEPKAPVASPSGRVPKVARLMALAIKLDGMLQRGEVKDYAELTRLGHVTRARLTQIMNLLNLAPDIQEAILFLPATERGRDALKVWQVRPVARHSSWVRQRNAACFDCKIRRKIRYP